MEPQSQTITVSKVTPLIFNQLYADHGDTLSCPCTTNAILFKDFVSNEIIFHPICSSIFVSQQWIQALYNPNASTYTPPDFRTTAMSQFEILASFCSLSQDTVFENQIDIGNNEYITISLLPEVQVQTEVNGTVGFLKNSASAGIISFLNYLRIITRANYLISALNTNAVMGFFVFSSEYRIMGSTTFYSPYSSDTDKPDSHVACSNTNPITPAGFFEYSTVWIYEIHQWWYLPSPGTIMVDGFFGGCTPLESILQSTLDCLYDVTCIQLLLNYFPALNQIQLNWTNSVLTSKQQNASVIDYLDDLFIEEWSIEMNYSKYFDECAASYCTYTTTDRNDFTYAITLSISLYGGLIVIFRLIAPFLISSAMKLRYRPRNANVNLGAQNTFIYKFIESVKRLNLFKVANERTENNIKQQKIITRVYLILLTGSFLILLFFTSLSTQTVTITVKKPSLSIFNDLQAVHPDTLKCPCSTVAIPYQKFVSLSPILHQICSSDFVGARWLVIMGKGTNSYISSDWRNIANGQLLLLSNLCQLANNMIDDAIHRFLLQTFIASTALIEIDLNTQLNATLNQLFQSTIVRFAFLVDTVTFVLSGPTGINSGKVNCICATNPNCEDPVAVDNNDYVYDHVDVEIAYIVPGSIAGCSSSHSLQLSTLECFYSDSDCFSIVMNYIQKAYFANVLYPVWFDPSPLIYDSRLSRFPPNTSINTIVKNIMVEEWNPSTSYNNFYESCAPNYCTYSQTIPTNSVVGVIIKLVSMIGGLIVSLHLITPLLVKFIIYLLSMINKRQQEPEQQQVRLKWFDQLKLTTRNVASLVYTKSISLNIFPRREFGNNIDQVTVRRLGQWSTRLYIALMIIGLAILTLYSVVQPHSLTKSFNQPSFNLYNQLFQKYGDQLKCSCSSIASTYNHFVKIEPAFHEICSSPFVSDEWRMNLTAGLDLDLSSYTLMDYRRFLSAHLQYLQGLCKISIESTNNSVDQLLSSLLVTTQLLPETVFYERTDLLIKHSKSSAPTTFARLNFLTRSVNHGNAIISSYGTNFEYIGPWYGWYSYAITQPKIYDNGCSCALYPNCTSQARFIEMNSSEIIPIRGLKIGCTPSESFLLSNLACFYDQSCINIIQQYTNSTNSSISLAITKSQFSINTTIAELINDLFVEEWATNINYSSYYEQCSPLLCSYTYSKQINLLYTITLILGLQGGLTIVLKWICPKIVRIAAKSDLINVKNPVFHLTSLIPSCQLQFQPIKIDVGYDYPELQSPIVADFNNDGRLDLAFISNNNAVNLMVGNGDGTLTLQWTFLAGSLATLLGVTFGDLNGDSILDLIFIDQNANHVGIFFGYGNGTFDTLTTLSTGNNSHPYEITVANFNGDNYLDIAVTNEYGNNVGVFLGKGNRTFSAQTTFATGFSSHPHWIVAVDFNNDSYIDIAVVNFVDRNIGVFIGHGNGTFDAQQTYFAGGYYYVNSFAIGDFNSDGHLDVAVSYFYSYNNAGGLGILFGCGNGTLNGRKIFNMGTTSVTSQITVGDFNGDGHLDVVVCSGDHLGLNVLVGDGNGDFGLQTMAWNQSRGSWVTLNVGDFNGDGYQDIVYTDDSGNLYIFLNTGQCYQNKTLETSTRV
ncbi:unnamed protein product [Adineta steineri]|uniref:Uncharacterized protein n=1 Tax=Adineta steineri TaxID=433720 RepID=A0A814UT71_9BILA|nr:unnamed protein product [Adineta steineri]